MRLNSFTCSALIEMGKPRIAARNRDGESLMKMKFWSGLVMAATLIVSTCSGASNSSDKPLFVSAIDYADFTPAAG